MGKTDESKVANAMQVALLRYEKELEKKKQLNELHLRDFKEKIKTDEV